MAERLLVIGADAAGMTAASQARKRRRDLDDLSILAFDRGRFASYSACGIPYWIAGDLERGADQLIARTPEEHRKNGIELRMRTEVESIDLGAGRVHVRNLETGTPESHAYDQLVIATGAVPIAPDLPGMDAVNVFGIQTLDDGAAVLDALDTEPKPKRAVVVGAGYIGVEMAEAMIRHGLDVTVVEQLDEPLSTLDPDMGRLVHDAMEKLGIDVQTGAEVEGLDTDDDGRARAVSVRGGEDLPADIVVLGIGVRPNTDVAREAGLKLGATDAIRTDLRMRAEGHAEVWAGGDCVEVLDIITGEHLHVPLGTHANKQGKVIGTNIGGGYATFPGIVRTAVSKVCDLEIARTGLLEADARRVGYEFEAVTIQSTTKAGYFPGTQPMTVKMIAERGTGLLLGGQIVGNEGSGKRIDTIAVALWNRMTVEELAAVDLSYAPPFSPVWDAVLVAARKAAEAVTGSPSAG
jgi:NADPH-dependent 2,4-dienoyl-CoA reductase/sulfur reductase-like enzyme